MIFACRPNTPYQMSNVNCFVHMGFICCFKPTQELLSADASFEIEIGGNGGRGGDVILECSAAVWDFSNLQHHLVCSFFYICPVIIPELP